MQQLSEFAIKHWYLVLTAFFLSAMLIWELLRSRVSGYQDIESSQAVGLINREDALILDVRDESEFKSGHLADALHISLGSLKSRLNELENHKDKPVIVICRSGNRSASACGLLAKQGFTKLYNLRGGIGAWQSANLPITKGGKSKKR